VRATCLSDLDQVSTLFLSTRHLHSNTRIKPLALALANGHGRCMTVTPEQALLGSVEGWQSYMAAINLQPFKP
jgi:hypothetical protein